MEKEKGTDWENSLDQEKIGKGTEKGNMHEEQW